MKRPKKSKKITFNSFSTFLLIAVFMLGIGYASISSISLNISGTAAAKAQDGIFISNVVAINSASPTLSYADTLLYGSITMDDNVDSIIEYNITIHNNTDSNASFDQTIDTVIEELHNLNNNENITYKIIGLNKYDVIKKRSFFSYSKTFKIRFMYREDLTQDVLDTFSEEDKKLNLCLKFDFRDNDLFIITYEDIEINDYQESVFKGENLIVNFTENAPEDIAVFGTFDDYTYVDSQLIINNINSDIIIMETAVYYHHDPIEFNGTSDYINTGVYLYNVINIDKDFEVSFNIDEIKTNETFATIFNTFNEGSGSGLGEIFRFSSDANKYEMVLSHTNKIVKTFELSEVNKVKIIREDGVLYYSINDAELVKATEYSNSTYLNLPAIFGASLDANGNPFRYFNGTLSRLKIRWLNVEQKESMNIVYENSNEIVLNGTSDYIDTNISLFSKENFEKDFSIKLTINSTGTSQLTEATLLNSMQEISSNSYPGFVLRIKSSTSKLFELSSRGSTNLVSNITIQDGTTIQIMRLNQQIFYTIDGNSYTKIGDFTNFEKRFDTPLTIGASLDSNENPFRYFNGTISNIVVALE